VWSTQNEKKKILRINHRGHVITLKSNEETGGLGISAIDITNPTSFKCFKVIVF
jgi:hypothetical protein